MNAALYTPKQLSKLFGVTSETLIQWEKEGKITAQKTPGGHRRYVYHTPSQPQEPSDQKISYVYARVSSPKQKGDMERQIAFLQSKFPNHQVVSDIGSGINFKRRGLITLLDHVFGGRVQEVVVAHRDRLSRFGFELFELIFERFGTTLRVLSDPDDKEPVHELAKDLLSIVTVFTARYYGSRAYSKVPKAEDLSYPRASRSLQQMPRRIKVLLQPRRPSHRGKRNQGGGSSEKERSEASGHAK
jgi:predicted site-specific integrase-resolvase